MEQYESDREMSEDDQNFIESDEFTSDEEQSVDIVSEQKEENSCEESANINKFSIDSILGLNRKCKEEKIATKEIKFIKPTPLPAAPRTG